jgi:hypothetical protein
MGMRGYIPDEKVSWQHLQQSDVFIGCNKIQAISPSTLKDGISA